MGRKRILDEQIRNVNHLEDVSVSVFSILSDRALLARCKRAAGLGFRLPSRTSNAAGLSDSSSNKPLRSVSRLPKSGYQNPAPFRGESLKF